ncbi:MAG: uroporphyrinogen decarboxylase family protein [Candidatus Acidiferrales bacterium]
MNRSKSIATVVSPQPPAQRPWEGKREQRFERWLSAPGIRFASPAAEQGYHARLTRIIRAIRVQEPDRVPCLLPAGQFPASYAGITVRTAMYDYEEMKRAWRKFLYDFDGDTCVIPGVSVTSGRLHEITKTRMSVWPGHGLAENAPMAQFVEGEYMKADEYDALLKDPADFFMRVYLPRTLGAFEPFQKLLPFRRAFGMPAVFLGACMLPEVQEAFQAVIDAGKELAKFRQAVAEISKEAQAAGYPPFHGGFAHAPFDLFGDTLRGTRGIMMDMYRQPAKLQEAMEVVTPWIVEGAVSGADVSGVPITFMALHKGDDTFMSEKQFETFYWPGLKKVILGLVAEGCVPLLFAEGCYNKRLEAVKDLPEGSVIWWFDRTDMVRAKKILGDRNCIAGNVPTSLMCTGTPREVKEHCRNLIEVCGKRGGYILTGGAQVHNTTAENLRAMVEAAKEYGVYQ